MTRTALFVFAFLFVVGWSARAHGALSLVFQDNFDNGASPLWGNELGDWAASGGVYSAQAPSVPGVLPSEHNYSGLPLELTDFVVEVDINDIADGGIWLRSTDNRNGVLLVTGGRGGTETANGGRALYWAIALNDDWPFGTILNPVEDLFDAGVSDPHLRIVVSGDNYSVYVNGSDTAATSLTTNLFASGRVGLYDRSGQSFDNLRIEVEAVPEASTALIWSTLIGCIGAGRACTRRRAIMR